MVDWPTSLPQAFSGDGSYQEIPENTVLRSTMDTGVTKTRRRQTRAEARVSGIMHMNGTQVATFINFFQTTTRGGSLSFGGWLSRNRQRQEYQFIDEPTVKHIGGDSYEVGLNLKIMPQGPAVEEPGDPGGPVDTDPTGRSIPIAHAQTHKSGGTDQIRLDELAQPLDSLALNASVDAHGLLPKLSGTATTYLNGAGQWATPSGGSGGSQSFTTIASPGLSSVTADQPNDTLTIEGNNGIAIATTPATDTITLLPIYGTTFGTVCQGNDVRLSNSRTPVAHASEHKSGGTDSIPIDELAPASDNTLLNASTAKHGLLPKLSGTATQYLTGVGTWATPASSSARSIKDFGAVGNSNGTTGNGANDTAAIQAALDATQGFLFIPAGTYRVTSTLYIRNHVYLYGEGAAPFIGVMDPGNRGPGSWIYFDHTLKGIEVYVTPEPTTITGVILKDFGTMRNQPTPTNAPWTPIDNDYDFHIQTSRVMLLGLLLWNTCRGILVDQYGHGLGKVTIDNLRGQCFNNGITFHRTYDLPIVNNVHLWSFWSGNNNVYDYQKANYIGMLVYRADGLALSNFFVIFAFAGIAFGSVTDAQGQGTHLRGQYTNVYIDLCTVGLLVDESVNGNMSFQCNNIHLTCNEKPGSMSMRIRGNNTQLDFGIMECAFARGTAISIEGTGNSVYIGRLRVNGWSWDGGNSFAVVCNSGNELLLGTAARFADGSGAPFFAGSGTIKVPSLVEQARG